MSKRHPPQELIFQELISSSNKANPRNLGGLNLISLFIIMEFTKVLSFYMRIATLILALVLHLQLSPGGTALAHGTNTTRLINGRRDNRPIKKTEVEACLNGMISFLGCLPTFGYNKNMTRNGGQRRHRNPWSMTKEACCEAVVGMKPSCFVSVMGVLSHRAPRADFRAALDAPQMCAGSVNYNTTDITATAPPPS